MTHKIIHEDRSGIPKNFDRKKEVQNELLEDLDIGVRKLRGGVWNGLFNVGLGTIWGLCEDGSQLAGCIRGGMFLGS